MTSQHDTDDQVVDPGWLTVEEAAGVADKTEGYIRRLAREGAIAARRDGRRWLVSAEAAQRLRTSIGGLDEHQSWDLERRLLYAERAELQLQLAEQRIESLAGENDSLRAENERLRSAVLALAGRGASNAERPTPTA